MWLCYDVEVAGRSRVQDWASPCDDLKNLFVNTAVNGTLFESGNDKATKGESWAPPFICCVQDAVGL